MRKPSGVSTKAWSGLLLVPGSTVTPLAFHLATCSWTLFTMNPTWFTTEPCEPPAPAAFPSPRLMMTPGNRTDSAAPTVTGVPPMPTKIFLLA